ncbi:beta-1,3-galactosyltransferase 5 isoform X2 [Rhodnius prolixus]|uniref:beta-1,3-galactosyltransferase 5 isoform X2 n=1 Tax=Rhodnius prolixus TaxID=13249 RepID=UPI003D18931C
MFDKRCCRLVWALTMLTFGLLALWQLTGCPGPPAQEIASRDHRLALPALSPARFQPLLPNNVSTVPDPYPVHSLPDMDFTKLIDLDGFSFITTRSPCNNSTASLLITLVHSAPAHVENRKRIRSTWGQPLDLVFLVGETNSTKEKELLEAEMKEFGDIVQGTFQDTYRNLTYKHTMGLKWVAYHCPGARYILKTDDDIFVNTPYLLEIIKNDLSPLGGRRLLLCNVMKGVRAKRTYRSKWRVSPVEYPERWYPDYCAGWVILYTPDVAFTLYRAAQQTPYFWIDDVHITGTHFTINSLDDSGINQKLSGKITFDLCCYLVGNIVLSCFCPSINNLLTFDSWMRGAFS